MNELQTSLHGERPLLLRIVNFPLVTMLIAILFYAFAAALGIVLASSVAIGAPADAVVHAFIPLAFIVAAYKLVIARLGNRPRDDLRAAGSLPELGSGIALGAMVFGTILALAALLGVYRIVGKGSQGDLLIPFVMVGIMPGFTEEILFRGIVFRWIEEWGGSWLGLLLSSLAFGFAHYFNPGSTAEACLWIAIEAGILLGGAYMLTRSLWMPIGLHAAWNFVQGPIFGVPVSGTPVSGLVAAKLQGPELLTGGQFGLEASVIALVVATTVGVVLVWLALRRGRIVPPAWVE